jgi:hypothetical protein
VVQQPLKRFLLSCDMATPTPPQRRWQRGLSAAGARHTALFTNVWAAMQKGILAHYRVRPCAWHAVGHVSYATGQFAKNGRRVNLAGALDAVQRPDEARARARELARLVIVHL